MMKEKAEGNLVYQPHIPVMGQKTGCYTLVFPNRCGGNKTKPNETKLNVTEPEIGCQKFKGMKSCLLGDCLWESSGYGGSPSCIPKTPRFENEAYLNENEESEFLDATSFIEEESGVFSEFSRPQSSGGRQKILVV